MDLKTKSILIGLASSFVAVMLIVILFFSLADIGGKKKPVDTVKPNDGSSVVVSDGGEVTDDTQKTDAQDTVSSEEPVSSEAEKETVGPFGRADIDVITENKNTFAKVVKAVNPVSYEWTAENMSATGEVDVKLMAEDGSYAVIGVPYQSSDYTVGGEASGLGIDVTDWEIYDETRKKEARIKEIVWLSNSFGFTLPRDVKIGTSYKDIAPAYLQVTHADSQYTMYDVSDVITDENKLKTYKNTKGAYIGAKLYKTTTLLSKVYPDDSDAYPFANNSKNIYRYGYNSIVDTKNASGQYYLEYATQNSKVMGVYYHATGAKD